MDLRRKKISTGVRSRRYQKLTLYPILTLEGNWLRNAGFIPGSHVYIFVEDQKIILKIKGETDLEQKSMQMFDALNER